MRRFASCTARAVRCHRSCVLLGMLLVLGSPVAGAAAAAPAASASFRERLPQDEVIFFLLPDRFANGDPANDRGGLSGDRLTTGFDPGSKAFYHGGDLKGLLARLDYIQGLGATAVWLAPIFRNKPVQGPPGHESAGYHGYWVTDFTRVDPHFGSNEDFEALVAAAHQRGMKVYLDIIVNHTADVIRYRECPRGPCAYRAQADYPWTRRGGVNGAPINAGFLGIDVPYQTAENFERLTRADYAYTPYVPAGEEHVKVPEWLNDPIYYHNRGDSTFSGESVTLGDFFGLDDLMTENPRVLRGFIDIYGAWIDRYGIDGFRIDTAKHVNPEFWQQFVPAMLARARARGIPNFHIFGEIFSGSTDVAPLALHTRVDGLPAVLDFAFANAVRETVGGESATEVLAHVFDEDALYEGGAQAALQLPTFVSNHDAGRFAYVARTHHPGIADAELLQRVRLAYAMLLTLRGVPVIYYGDEQGFAGLGGDQDARQDMFASRVPSYLDEQPSGSATQPDGSRFDPQSVLYREIAALARLRTHEAALRRGRQLLRASAAQPGLFAVSRFDPENGHEVLIAFNTSGSALRAQVPVQAGSHAFASLHGSCAATASAPGSYQVTIPPRDYLVCAATGAP